MSEPKFKVGDRVRVARVDVASWRELVGTTGPVIQVDSVDLVYPYLVNLNGEHRWFKDRELEPEPPLPIPTPEYSSRYARDAFDNAGACLEHSTFEALAEFMRALSESRCTDPCVTAKVFCERMGW